MKTERTKSRQPSARREPGPPEGRAGTDEPVERKVLLALLGITAVGAVLRALHLDVPLRYDEVHTFTEYAREGWLAATSSYENPNNHVLHTVFVALSTDVFGDGPVAIRLPAFLAGCLIPLVAGLLALRGARGRQHATLWACALTAGWSVLVEFSTNGRGYTMVLLFTLLAALLALDVSEGRRGWRWIALGAVSVAGLYTIPIMVLPWLGIVLHLAYAAWRGPPERRLRDLAAVAGFASAVGLVALYLYLPVLLAEGAASLVANRYVSALAWEPFLEAVPGLLLAVLDHWTWGVPLPVVALAGAGLVFELARPGGRRFPAALLVPMLAVSVIFVLTRRALGYERVWLWLVPLVLVVASLGLQALVDGIVERFPRRRPLTLAVRGAPLLILAWMALHLAGGDYVLRSLDTGGFPEGPAVARFLTGARRQGDFVTTDFISRVPLDYYLDRQPPPSGRREGPPVGWVVLNRSELVRRQQVLDALARQGLSLNDLELEAEIGAVLIYSSPWEPGEGGG